MTAPATIPGLRCDGPFPVGEPVAEQWTVTDESSPAFGASFYVRPGEDVAARLAETVKRFAESAQGSS